MPSFLPLISLFWEPRDSKEELRFTGIFGRYGEASNFKILKKPSVNSLLSGC